MRKPGNFVAKIYIEFVSNELTYDILYDFCKQYGFHIDYDCGNMFCIGPDSIYENLESRMIFFLKILKKENFVVKYYIIEALIFNSKIHGNLI